MRVRLARLFLASVVALGLAACSTSNSTTSAVSIPSRGAVTYIAIGDSLTAGWGSSLCGPPATLAAVCVTSPTQAGVVGNNTNYSALIAASLNPTHSKVTYTPLGVGGAFTGGAPLRENPQSGDVLTNPAQIPALPGLVSAARTGGNKVFISLLIGPNDVTDALTSAGCLQAGVSPGGFGSPICSASGTSMSDASGNVLNGSFYRGYLAVLNAIGATNPDAVLVIGLPDASKTPRFAIGPPPAPAATLAAIGQFVGLGNAAIKLAIANSNIASKTSFFDSFAAGAANPLLYSPQFFSADGYHPNDVGYGNLASSIIPQVQLAFPTL